MEDEEEPRDVNTVGECKEELKAEMSKTKASRIQENGVVSKDAKTISDKHESSDDEGTFSSVKRIKLSNDDNSVDTAETIKKIQAFIALGKSDDSRDGSEPEDNYASSPAKKSVESKDHQEVPNDGVSNISDLQRTLQGLDDSQDNNDNYEDNRAAILQKVKKEKNVASPLKENNRDSRRIEASNKNDLYTPSRVSKRIQSKSNKFSAKKLLKGDDDSDDEIVKRKLPDSERRKKTRKERSAINLLRTEPKQVKLVGSVATSESSLVKESTSETEKEETLPVETNEGKDMNVNSSKGACSSTMATPSHPPSKSSLVPPVPEILNRFPITNGKITLELTGNQKKKVVRIAMPPVQPPLPKAALGPDIIIKRVKPVKKTIAPETPKETLKLVEKEPESRPQASEPPPLISVTSRESIEKVPVQKLKSNINKIQKNIIKTVKADELKSSLTSVKYVSLQKPSRKPSDTNVESSEAPFSQQVTEAAENKAPVLKTLSSEPVKQPAKRGRKPKHKTESNQKKSKRKEEIDKSPDISDEELPAEEETKEEFESLFDKYFITTERYIEHHDSLDSDSSVEFDSEYFTHFINLRDQKLPKKKNVATVYDLMQDISIELPTWNIHASSDGETFYLVEVDNSKGKPVMKKVVEIDQLNNANVYVNNKILPEYKGNYRTYEDIRQLIYDVDQL